MSNETITEFIRKSINILFVANPKGTSIGILLGVIFDGFIGLFMPFLKGLQSINIAAIKMWHLMGLGVVIINLPIYWRRNEIDPSILKAIEYIENQKKLNHIADWQVRQMYANLHQKVLESINLNAEMSQTTVKLNTFVNPTGQDGQTK